MFVESWLVLIKTSESVQPETKTRPSKNAVESRLRSLKRGLEAALESKTSLGYNTGLQGDTLDKTPVHHTAIITRTLTFTRHCEWKLTTHWPNARHNNNSIKNGYKCAILERVTRTFTPPRPPSVRSSLNSTQTAKTVWIEMHFTYTKCETQQQQPDLKKICHSSAHH